MVTSPYNNTEFTCAVRGGEIPIFAAIGKVTENCANGKFVVWFGTFSEHYLIVRHLSVVK